MKSIFSDEKTGITDWKINISEKKFKDYADLGKFRRT